MKKAPEILKECENKKLTLIGGIYEEYIYLAIFIRYYYESKAAMTPTEQDILIMKILTSIQTNYNISASFIDILIGFYWERFNSWMQKIVWKDRIELSSLLAQKSKYENAIKKYNDRFKKFDEDIREKMREGKTFDEAFLGLVNIYIPHIDSLLPSPTGEITIENIASERPLKKKEEKTWTEDKENEWEEIQSEKKERQERINLLKIFAGDIKHRMKEWATFDQSFDQIIWNYWDQMKKLLWERNITAAINTDKYYENETPTIQSIILKTIIKLNADLYNSLLLKFRIVLKEMVLETESV